MSVYVHQQINDGMSVAFVHRGALTELPHRGIWREMGAPWKRNFK